MFYVGFKYYFSILGLGVCSSCVCLLLSVSDSVYMHGMHSFYIILT